MKAQKQNRINLYSVKGAWRFDQSIQSKIIALAFSLAAEIERDLISQRTKEALRFKKAQGMKLGRPTAPAKRKLDPYRPEIENLLANGSTQGLSPVATTQPRPILTKHGLNCQRSCTRIEISERNSCRRCEHPAND
jgi:DNA invertase Pin-like site-specific DNA recombinase